MIDSHCHLDDSRVQQDLAAMLQRAHRVGVTHHVIAGVHHRRWSLQQAIQQRYTGVSNAFGVHPWFCHEHQEQDWQQLFDYIPDAVAIGECGLDGMKHRPPMALQKRWFQKHIDLAAETGLPLVIHAVKAVHEVLAMLQPYPQIRGVVHGFSGSLEQANEVMRAGFLLGMGTRVMNNPSEKVRQMLCGIPLSSILLESDAPDGLPQGERNEPANLRQVVTALSKLRNQDESLIVSACTAQTKELFHL